MFLDGHDGSVLMSLAVISYHHSLRRPLPLPSRSRLASLLPRPPSSLALVPPPTLSMTMLSLGNTPSIFAYLPVELALTIFQLAACASQQTGKSLIHTSSAVRKAILPHYMRNVHLRNEDASELFFETISYKPELAALVQCIWLEGVRPELFYLQSFPNLSALIISDFTPSPLTPQYHRTSLMCESNSIILGLLMDLQSRSNDQPILGTGVKHVTVAFHNPVDETNLARLLSEVRFLEPRLAWLPLYKYSGFRDGWCGQQIEGMDIWDLAEKNTASAIAALQTQTGPDTLGQAVQDDL